MVLTLDSALNLAWLGLSLSALAIIAMRDRSRHLNGRSRLQRVAALFLIALSLFPSVSVSDDEVSFWYLNRHSAPRGSMGVPIEESKEKATQQLARFLDVIESDSVAVIWQLALVLLVVSIVVASISISPERPLLCRAGRAPPALL